MSGDWLKIEATLPDKPEVWQMAGILGIDPDAVVGKLFKVWRWFDQHTLDGNANGVTYALVDSKAGVIGFAESMAHVGWLEQADLNLRLPHFDRHNGQTAKNRGLTAKRVAKYKEKSNVGANANNVTDALPREEKRREEKKEQKQRKTAPPVGDLFPEVNPKIVLDFLAIRKAKRLPVTDTAIAGIVREAAKANLTLQAALTICCEKGWGSFEAEWLGKPGLRAVAGSGYKPVPGEL